MSLTNELRLAKNFNGIEFRCPGEHDEPSCGCHGALLVENKLATLAQRLRSEVWERPLIVLSGYRCDDHNAYVGGHEFSYHRYGMAMDARVTEIVGMGADRVADYLSLADRCVSVMNDLSSGDDEPWGRCIVYPKRGFIHMDIGTYPDDRRIVENWSEPKRLKGY